VPEAGGSIDRGGRQRPAIRRPVAEAVERVVKTRFPPVSLMHRGARALRCPRSRRTTEARRATNAARASTRREPRDERIGESRLRRREHETHDGTRRKDSECRRRFGRIVDRDAPEHARARSRTRADGLERLAHRAVTRATREKTSGIGAGISQHAVEQAARRGSIERAQAASGASSTRCGSGDSGCPSGCERSRFEDDVRVFGAWMRPL